MLPIKLKTKCFRQTQDVLYNFKNLGFEEIGNLSDQTLQSHIENNNTILFKLQGMQKKKKKCTVSV